jgi:hypothetical protein
LACGADTKQYRKRTGHYGHPLTYNTNRSRFPQDGIGTGTEGGRQLRA